MPNPSSGQARALAGIDGATMGAIREAIIKEDFDKGGVRFSDGSLGRRWFN
jgi:hypothetical protein